MADRVISSGYAFGAFAFLGVCFPPGWALALGVGVSVWFVVDGQDEPVAVAILWLPALLLWWLWWRIVGRSCRRRDHGVRVRSFWRSFDVGWSDLLDVGWTEYEGVGRSFSFSKTTVTFDRGGEPRTVVVSHSFRSGHAGYARILGWLPADHPLRAAFVERPAVVVDGPRTPVVGHLRPAPSLLAVYFVLLAVGGIASVVGAVLCAVRIGENGAWAVGAAVLVVVAGALVWVAVRLGTSHVTVTSTELVNKGVLGTVVHPVEAIETFLVARSGAGAVLRVVLKGAGSRGLAAGNGFGAHPYETQQFLESWLDRSR